LIQRIGLRATKPLLSENEQVGKVQERPECRQSDFRPVKSFPPRSGQPPGAATSRLPSVTVQVRVTRKRSKVRGGRRSAFWPAGRRSYFQPERLPDHHEGRVAKVAGSDRTGRTIGGCGCSGKSPSRRWSRTGPGTRERPLAGPMLAVESAACPRGRSLSRRRPIAVDGADAAAAALSSARIKGRVRRDVALQDYSSGSSSGVPPFWVRKT